MKTPVSSTRNDYITPNTPAVSRRRFITSCSACAACFALKPAAFLDRKTPARPVEQEMKIKIVYSLHEPVQTQPDWPNVGFDFNPHMIRITNALKNNFPDIEFITQMASGEEDARKIVAEDEINKIDGYIVCQMNCWNRVVQTLVKTGKPVLYADFKYGGSGGFLVYTAGFIAENTGNIGYVASSKIEDLLSAAKCFKTIGKNGNPDDFGAAVTRIRITSTPDARKHSARENRIKTLSPGETVKQLGVSRILAVRDQNSRAAENIMGIPMEYIPFSEINEAWKNADRDESVSIAGQWQKSALEVIGVNVDTLITSAAMYLGMKEVLRQHNANAITVNCLGGFYGGHIHAYPCLGFHELCNEGLIGACECDINSTATMMAFSTLTGGRPGFISDPVIDTSKRQIIYAHCVASNSVFGPGGKRNQFRIMTHSEDRNGASVQSVLPLNYLTTTLQINNQRKEILLHQAVAVDNDPDDRACRTKLCAEPVGDIEKLFTMWNKWGWHRVTFYGDLKEPVYALADSMDWKVIEEA